MRLGFNVPYTGQQGAMGDCVTFLNMLKNAREFAGPSDAVKDANGYYTTTGSVPNNRKTMRFGYMNTNLIGNPVYDTTYRLAWRGSGTMSIEGFATIVSQGTVTFSDPHTMEAPKTYNYFDTTLTPSGGDKVWLVSNVDESQVGVPLDQMGDLVGHPRDFHCVPLDYWDEYTAGRVAHPVMLEECIKLGSVARFMNYSLVNYVGFAPPEQRYMPATNVTYNLRAGKSGTTLDNTAQTVPYTVQAKIANEFAYAAEKTQPLRTYPFTAWFNIPADATDERVRKIVRELCGTLRPDIIMAIEFANETWNSFFETYGYCKKQGLLEFPTAPQINSDNNRPTQLWTAHRASQMFTIIRDEMGEARFKRCRLVQGTWATDQNWTSWLFSDDAVTYATTPAAPLNSHDNLVLAAGFYLGTSCSGTNNVNGIGEGRDVNLVRQINATSMTLDEKAKALKRAVMFGHEPTRLYDIGPAQVGNPITGAILDENTAIHAGAYSLAGANAFLATKPPGTNNPKPYEAYTDPNFASYYQLVGAELQRTDDGGATWNTLLVFDTVPTLTLQEMIDQQIFSDRWSRYYSDWRRVVSQSLPVEIEERSPTAAIATSNNATFWVYEFGHGMTPTPAEVDAMVTHYTYTGADISGNISIQRYIEEIERTTNPEVGCHYKGMDRETIPENGSRWGLIMELGIPTGPKTKRADHYAGLVLDRLCN